MCLSLRKTSNMEDSSAMTIEFLRARLLSERSISRSARQRADELANKVCLIQFYQCMDSGFFDLFYNLLYISLNCFLNMSIRLLN